MTRSQKFIDLALEEAKKSSMSKQHGAVIVLRGRVLAKGHNKYQGRALGGRMWREELQETLRRDWILREPNVPFSTYSNSMWGKSDCSLHAEMDAIIKAGYCPGATLYVARRRITDGMALESTPCKRCHKAAQRKGLKIVYTVGSLQLV